MIVAPSVLMEAALEVARIASLVAFRYYKHGIAVETKSDGALADLARTLLWSAGAAR